MSEHISSEAVTDGAAERVAGAGSGSPKGSSTPTVAWALGLAACICNLIIILMPIGIILGLVALILGLVSIRSSTRQGAARSAGLVLSGVSFVIAAIWIGTIVSVFVMDPTLL